MDTCSACAAENRAGARFCSQCGTALVLRCASCGAANEPGDRFCGQCGVPLNGAPAAEGPGPVAERRLVSVLFADLVGFTTRSEHRDPEEVRELLSVYFDRCRDRIERYGVGGDVRELDVPEALHARSRRGWMGLSGEQRSLLQDTAVLGHASYGGARGGAE